MCLILTHRFNVTARSHYKLSLVYRTIQYRNSVGVYATRKYLQAIARAIAVTAAEMFLQSIGLQVYYLTC